MARQVKARVRAADTQSQKRLHLIHGTLRNRIIMLTYPPGMLLKEAEMAAEFGVSRTPIRQALQKLQFEGLVETINAVGTIVTNYQSEEMNGLVALRVRIDEIVGDLARRDYSSADIADMESLVRRTKSLEFDHDLEEYLKIINSHHEILRRIIDTDALRDIYDNLHFRTARQWWVTVPKLWQPWMSLTISELNEMIRSMKSKDTKGVMAVRRNYVRHFAVLIEGLV
ncbi:GntR family transcriptional regulator [Mesorhizobium shangrilense]|uniref:GntR family transcriptional regulator n=1 Tax=Mesorhizobium shangrilense TaxID=460060 RepID=A0ABV2DS22_9HYPH